MKALKSATEYGARLYLLKKDRQKALLQIGKKDYRGLSIGTNGSLAEVSGGL